jgi:hypothetical protein
MAIGQVPTGTAAGIARIVIGKPTPAPEIKMSRGQNDHSGRLMAFVGCGISKARSIRARTDK